MAVDQILGLVKPKTCLGTRQLDELSEVAVLNDTSVAVANGKD